MDEHATRDTGTSVLYRDPVVSFLFGFSFLVILAFLVAEVIFAFSGYVELLRAALLLTMAFAVIGAMFGLVRGLRSRKPAKRRSA
jgi:hypothetical protein